MSRLPPQAALRLQLRPEAALPPDGAVLRRPRDGAPGGLVPGLSRQALTQPDMTQPDTRQPDLVQPRHNSTQNDSTRHDSTRHGSTHHKSKRHKAAQHNPTRLDLTKFIADITSPDMTGCRSTRHTDQTKPNHLQLDPDPTIYPTDLGAAPLDKLHCSGLFDHN